MALRTLWSMIDWPLKRVSAAAFSEMSPIRSSTTLLAIDRGTCWDAASPRRLLEILG